jgi:hypothetical protein
MSKPKKRFILADVIFSDESCQEDLRCVVLQVIPAQIRMLKDACRQVCLMKQGLVKGRLRARPLWIDSLLQMEAFWSSDWRTTVDAEDGKDEVLAKLNDVGVLVLPGVPEDYGLVSSETRVELETVSVYSTGVRFGCYLKNTPIEAVTRRISCNVLERALENQVNTLQE